MDTTRLLDAFYLALDESPGDKATLCALADWYEEQGHLANASCVRWAMRLGLRPIRCPRQENQRARVQDISGHDGWYWWVVDQPNWVEERTCRLRPELWNRLAHSFPYEPLVFKEYPTLRAAYEALFEVWPAFAPRDRVARQREGAR